MTSAQAYSIARDETKNSNPFAGKLVIANKSIEKQTHKPNKPYPDFPLFAHATKRWSKKIRGRLVYFGPWSDPQGALNKYLAQKEELLAGRTPRPKDNALELQDLAKHFLTAKQRQQQAGEIRDRTFDKYHAVCRDMVAAFGPRRVVDDIPSSDFGGLNAQWGKRLGPLRLADQIQIVRSIFKFGFEVGLLDKLIRFGPEFKKPPRHVIRKYRSKIPSRFFEAEQIRQMVEAASPQMRGMILLGVNCAFGNTDVAELPMAAVDLAAAVVDWPRPKTGIPRRALLWPETVEALQTVLSSRPKPKAVTDRFLLFITSHGHRWIGPKKDSVGLEFGKLLRRLGMKRPGVNFYGLRHTFRTIADELSNRSAVGRIMGRENGGDIATYNREQIDDDCLQRVTEHVRSWLFATT